jgi:diaminobutyrate-2-oxoglutarate transaminase
MERQVVSTDTTEAFASTESGVRYYCREMPAVFSKAQNARVWDENGTEFIDLLSACGSLNYGHNHPALKARVIEYLERDGLLNGLDLQTEAKREFLRTFREIILDPRGLDYRVQFTGPTGTNAVEAALKLARKVTGRRSVVAFTNAFHGMTLGSLSVSARQSSRKSAGVSLGEVTRLPFDGYLGAGMAELDRFEAMVRDPSGGLEPPAAFIVETVQGEGGLNAARPEWLRHLEDLARRLGSLLIVDDVQAGCGRTGTFFSFEFAGIEPDLICLSKSIGGIGLPMALLLIKPEHDQWAPGEHNGTFRGNNLAFVAATEALEFWRNPSFRSTVSENASALAAWLKQAGRELGSGIARVRGRGLMVGLAFADPEVARLVSREAFQRRVLVETSGPNGEVLKLLPPLTIEKEMLATALLRLREAISAVLDRRIVPLRPAA